MPSKSTRRHPFDMSLRLWSNQIALRPIVERSGIPAAHLYAIGEPMAQDGPMAGRLSDQHYASIAHAVGSCDEDVAAWLTGVISIVESQDDLVEALRNKQIEALSWIAVFGREKRPIPQIDPSAVASIARLGVAVLVENYTDIDAAPDFPAKTWLAGGAP